MSSTVYFPSTITDATRGKTVLVTGGGGSIGSEICRQILRFGPSDLMVLGHGENSIFDSCAQLDQQLAALIRFQGSLSWPVPRVHPVIADIRFAERIRQIFERYRPEIVFHAAAHKHVPLMEGNRRAAFVNNVFEEKYRVYAFDSSLFAGVVAGVYAKPRTWGFSATYRFGGL